MIINDSTSYMMSLKDENYLVSRIKETASSDYIYLEDETQNKLFNIYVDKKLDYIPADIIFEGTVPIMDMVLQIEGLKESGNDAVNIEARIVIFEDYQKNIWSTTDELRVEKAIGAVAFKITKPGHEYEMQCLVPFFAQAGTNSVFGRSKNWVGFPDIKNDMNRQRMEYILKTTESSEVLSVAREVLTTWYTIQVSLLHPLTHTIFEHYTIEKLRGKDKKVLPKDEHGRVIKYVRHHRIAPEDLEFSLDDLGIPRDTKRQYTRKTLVWHVAGHWHTFQSNDGPRNKFVQGYWKGPLKDYKKNLDSPKRRIAVE